MDKNDNVTKVNEYIVMPFRLGDFEISAIWIDGIPMFKYEKIAEYLGYNLGCINSHLDNDRRISEVQEHMKEVELANSCRVNSSGGAQYTIVDFIGLFLILTKRSGGGKFCKAAAEWIYQHWEDVPEAMIDRTDRTDGNDGT